jgi:hypothetical protein
MSVTPHARLVYPEYGILERRSRRLDRNHCFDQFRLGVGYHRAKRSRLRVDQNDSGADAVKQLCYRVLV